MPQTLRLLHEPSLSTPTLFLWTLAGAAAGEALGYALVEDAPGLYSVATVADAVDLEGLIAEVHTGGVSVGTDIVRQSDGLWWVGETPGAAEIAALVVFPEGSRLAADIASQLAMAAVRSRMAAGPVITTRIVVRGTTWRISLPFELPASWTRLEFTARSDESDSQSTSLVHVVLSNPADAEADGLRILDGAAAEDATLGSIVTADVTTPQVVIAASATASLSDGEYAWDAKVFGPNGVDQDGRGTLYVDRDVTRSAA